MPKAGKVVDVPKAYARRYLAKAKEFASEAQSALSSGRYYAAMLNAIHAAISGSDAVTVALDGRRSADPDHQRAADLLERAVGDAAEARERVRHLRMLIRKKNLIEYEIREAAAREAADAVERARRFVEWATGIVMQAKA